MINSVTLMGRLTADPELKTTPTGIQVTSFRIAVERAYVKSGDQRQADFIDIVAWRNTAEFICKYFIKGSMIALHGAIQSRNYQDKEGHSRTAFEVVADQVSFCGGADNSQKQSAAVNKDERRTPANTSVNVPDSQDYYDDYYDEEEELSF